MKSIHIFFLHGLLYNQKQSFIHELFELESIVATQQGKQGEP